LATSGKVTRIFDPCELEAELIHQQFVLLRWVPIAFPERFRVIELSRLLTICHICGTFAIFKICPTRARTWQTATAQSYSHEQTSSLFHIQHN
jgi:hypothetical protein